MDSKLSSLCNHVSFNSGRLDLYVDKNINFFTIKFDDIFVLHGTYGCILLKYHMTHLQFLFFSFVCFAIL